MSISVIKYLFMISYWFSLIFPMLLPQYALPFPPAVYSVAWPVQANRAGASTEQKA